MQHQNSSVTKGDIVWVRVRFPLQFWPALVLCTDSLGVCVCFFTHNTSPRPRYVIESEVLPFERSFRWIMGRHRKDVKKCETFYALLDSALKLVGQRVLSSVKCRCQIIPSQRHCDGGGSNGRERFDGSNRNSCFQPHEVLGFVMNVAVLPWVNEVDFVDAVRAVAQVQGFRGYCSIEQKRVYQKTQKRGNDVKLLQCSSLGEKINSITQESVTLKPNYESQTPSEEVEKNLFVGAVKRMNSRIPVLKGNVNFADTFLEICHKTSKPHFSMLSCNFNRSKDIKTFTFFTKKRRRLDHPALCDCSFKLQKLSSLSSTNEASVNMEDESDAFILPSALAGCFSSCNKMENMDSYLASFLQSPMKLEIQNPCSNRGLSVTYIGGTLSSSNSLFKDSSCQVGFPPKDTVQETKEKGSDCTNDLRLNSFGVVCRVDSTLYQKRLQISSSSGDKTPLKSKKSARINTYSGGCLMKKENLDKSDTSYTMINSNVIEQSKTQVSHACSKSLHMKFPENFKLPSKWQLIKKFRIFGSVDYLKTRVSSFTGVAQVTFFQEADAVTAYIYAKRKKVSFGRAHVQFWLDSFKHKRGSSSTYSTLMSRSSEQVPLKSCLKNSSSQKKDDRKKPYRVRFTIVT